MNPLKVRISDEDIDAIARLYSIIRLETGAAPENLHALRLDYVILAPMIQTLGSILSKYVKQSSRRDKAKARRPHKSR